MKIKIVILNYNGLEYLPDCLDSVKNINYNNFEIVVIDNNSSDSSIEYISKKHASVKIIKIDRNLMFSGGYNYFFNQESEDCFYMILNNDTIVDSDILRNFMLGVDKYGMSNIYGAKIMYESEPDKIWYAGGEVDLSKGLIRHVGIREKEGEEVDCETDYITGCCMFVHSSIIKKLNGFDERFSMYMEDVDFCLRAQKKGIKCYFLKKPALYHKISKSISVSDKIFKNIFSYVKLSIKHSRALSVVSIPLFLIRRLLSI